MLISSVVFELSIKYERGIIFITPAMRGLRCLAAGYMAYLMDTENVNVTQK